MTKYYFTYRSNRSYMFFKIGFLKNFAHFTGKHLFWSLSLIKLQALRLGGKNFAKFLKIPFSTEHLWWQFLYIQKLPSRDFPGHLTKIIYTSYLVEYLCTTALGKVNINYIPLTTWKLALVSIHLFFARLYQDARTIKHDSIIFEC